MSTGADAKTMPITPAYAEGHERLFGERREQKEKAPRRIYVSRCSHCDGVIHSPGELLFDCGRCKGKDCYGLVDASSAPPLANQNEARNAGVLSGRFYENTSITIGDEKGRPKQVDVGSRSRYEAFCKERGVTPSSDYSESWKPESMERKARSEDLQEVKERRDAIARGVYEMEKQGRWR